MPGRRVSCDSYAHVQKDITLNTTVDEKSRTRHSIVHGEWSHSTFCMFDTTTTTTVDDDMIRFRTVTRPWAQFILSVLRPFCRHWVFTSATRGYMKNVVSLFEPPKMTSCRIFEDHRLSCSDFPKKFLHGGKPVSRLQLPKCMRAGSWKVHAHHTRECCVSHNKRLRDL